MERKNILVLFGGGGSEHEISRISAGFLIEKLKSNKNYNPISVEILKDGTWENENRKCSLNGRILKTPTEQPYIDYVIPCIHGKPGETGEIQNYLEILGLPYFGPNSYSSTVCFDKTLTKLWLDKINIPTTPWMFVNENQAISREKVLDFFKKSHNDIFIKAASQGSSVGCYHVTNENEIFERIEEALTYSKNVLIEQTIKGRELEVAVYDFEGNTYATPPGEVLCPDGFYSYEEKYSNDSHTKTNVTADIPSDVANKISNYALNAFKSIGLRHLSRVDFFYTQTGEIYLNEINTFPGMTPISMFPQMVEASGVNFEEFINKIIDDNLRK